MIIIAIVLVISLIILIYSIYHNRITFLEIKLKSVEEKINSTLLERKELIKDSEQIIKDATKTDKDIYVGISEVDNKTPGMMELDRKLLVYINEFYLIKNKYHKLNSNDNFKKISYKLNETEDKLNAYKDYYNECSANYNKLIKKFPCIFISIVKRRKEKLFFDKKYVSYENLDDVK